MQNKLSASTVKSLDKNSKKGQIIRGLNINVEKVNTKSRNENYWKLPIIIKATWTGRHTEAIMHRVKMDQNVAHSI